MKMDKTTEKLIKLLEENARYSIAELSSMLNISETEVRSLIRRLEDEKIICGYKTMIDWDKISDTRVTALIELKVKPQRTVGFEEIAAKIMQMDEVETVYLMSGGFDLTVIVQSKSFKDVALFVAKRLAVMDYVEATATHFVLRRYKELGVTLLHPLDDDRGIFSL